MQKISEQIKESIVELILSSTCHGLPSFFRTRRVVFKIMWMILFVGASAFSSYLIFNTTMDFLAYDFVTKIDIINESPTQFPTVTFCNLNPKYKRYNLSEVLISCRYGANKCTESDFTSNFDIRSGYCFVFNQGQTSTSDSIKTISMAGFYNGLLLRIYADPINPLDGAPLSNGFHIFVNNYTDPVDLNTGVDISIGKETRISVFREFSQKLDSPFNDCRNDLNSIDSFNSDIYKEMFSLNMFYTQKSCLSYLALKTASSLCNCSAPLNQLTQECLIKYLDLNGLDCLRNEYSSFFIKNNFEKLTEQCPLECNTINYKLITSTSDLNYKMVKSNIMSNDIVKNKYGNSTLPYDLLKKTTLVVSIYYEDLTYTKISQTPKTELLDLVSNIGGLLGLFVGTSFLSFAEIIEIILEVIFILFERKKTKVDEFNLKN